MSSKVRREKGKLKLHKRSHVSNKSFALNKHPRYADQLHRQAKKLEEELANEKRST